MGVKSEILVSHAAIIIAALFLATSASSQQERDEGRPPTMQDLGETGEAEQKFYFAEPSITMNWVEAKDYCNTYNFELATIETQAQVDFLKRTLAPLGLSKLYWTSAHESRPVKMVWDGNGKEPDTTFLTRWFWWEELRAYQYCATFTLYAADLRGDFDVHNCNSYQAHVLCQSKKHYD